MIHHTAAKQTNTKFHSSCAKHDYPRMQHMFFKHISFLSNSYGPRLHIKLILIMNTTSVFSDTVVADGRFCAKVVLLVFFATWSITRSYSQTKAEETADKRREFPVVFGRRFRLSQCSFAPSSLTALLMRENSVFLDDRCNFEAVDPEKRQNQKTKETKDPVAIAQAKEEWYVCDRKVSSTKSRIE